MTLNELDYGDSFILNRTGEKYVKLGKWFYKGKPTSRFLVKPYKKRSLDLIMPPTMNHQCEVTPITAP